MKRISIVAIMAFWSQSLWATFSIVAVDPVTGEIGSAGASCVSGQGQVNILSDVVLGVGVVHTQAYYLSANQVNARSRMESGDSPDEIMSWLEQNDVNGNPTQRQYLAVTFDGESATFSGANTDPISLGVEGVNYAIAGNILLEDEVVLDMEQAFLNTEGSLAARLMASLQAAKRIGADSRCGPFNISSAGAFLRVADVCDTDSGTGQLNVDLEVYIESGGAIFEPIDALQTAFDGANVTECVWDLVFESGFESQP